MIGTLILLFYVCTTHIACPSQGRPTWRDFKLLSHSTFRCLAPDGFRTYDVVLVQAAESCIEQPDAQWSGT